MNIFQRLDEIFARPDPWQPALDSVVQFVNADSGTIHLMEADGALHLRAATAGIPEHVLNIVRTVPVGKGMAGLAADRRHPVTVCNIQTDTSGDVRPGAKATGLEGAIALPMFRGDQVAGVLGVANRRERIFTGAETEILLEIGRSLAARA
jgi:signal transduction protein with GAF and PtsI domain